MSSKAAALRRIVRSIGKPALPPSSSLCHARSQHTASHKHDTQAHDPAAFGLGVAKAKQQHKNVINLLSSIEARLQDDESNTPTGGSHLKHDENKPISKATSSTKRGATRKSAKRRGAFEATSDATQSRTRQDEGQTRLNDRAIDRLTSSSLHDTRRPAIPESVNVADQPAKDSRPDDGGFGISQETSADKGRPQVRGADLEDNALHRHASGNVRKDGEERDDHRHNMRLHSEPAALQTADEVPAARPSTYSPSPVLTSTMADRSVEKEVTAPSLASKRTTHARHPGNRKRERRTVQHIEVLPPSPTSYADVSYEIERRHQSGSVKNLPPLSRDVSIRAGSKETKARELEQTDAHLRNRHDFNKFPRSSEWSTAMSILTSLTSEGGHAHVKVVETTSWPDGFRLTWTLDRNEAALKVGLNTKSALFFQRRDADRGTFRLTGTSKENAAARRFMLDTGLFKMTTTGVTMPNLREVMEKSTRVTHIHPLLDVSPGASDSLDFLRIQNDYVDRSHESKMMSSFPLGGAGKLPLSSLLKAAKKGLILEPFQLNTAVEALTSEHTARDLSALNKGFDEKNPFMLIADALSALLTNPANVANTWLQTLRTAWDWLLRNGHMSIVRSIQSAHDEYAARAPTDGIKVMDTYAFNALLQSCSDARDIHLFRYQLASMAQRSISADADSWIQFFRLTCGLFPDRCDLVLRKMFEIGVLQDVGARVALWRYYIPLEFKKDLEANQQHAISTSYIREWLDKLSLRIGTSRWLNSKVALEINAILLDRGDWLCALEVIRQCRAFDNKLHIGLLHQLLDSTTDAATAVQVLELFLRIPKARRLEFGKATYERLFHIATESCSWNLTRVVWQHACCAGNVSRSMRQRMEHCLLQHEGKKSTRSYVADKSVDFWRASFALLAVGVGARLQHPYIRLGLAKGEQRLFRRRSATAKYQMQKDLAAYGHVVPLRSLEEDSLEAVKLDLELSKRMNMASSQVGTSETRRKPLESEFVLVAVRSAVGPEEIWPVVSSAKLTNEHAESSVHA